MSTILPTDLFLVQRGDSLFKLAATSEDIEDYILPDDLLQVNRGSINYKMTGAEFKASLPISNGLYPTVPPFTLKSNTSIVLTNSDGKMEFSLDKASWSNTLAVSIHTLFHIRWTTNIDSVVQGAEYKSTLNVAYTLMGTSQTVEYVISAVNRVPSEDFSFAPVDGIDPNVVSEAEPIFPQTYNTPGWIWGTTNSTSAQIRIAGGSWIALPSVPNDIRVGPNEQVGLRHTTLDGSSSVTTTTLSIGYATGAGERREASYTTTNYASSILQPRVVSPNEGQQNLSRNITFTGTPFSGNNSGPHTSTNWQIASDSSFSNITWQSMNDTTNLESIVATLPNNTARGTYYFRIQYNTATISSQWSPAVSAGVDFISATGGVEYTPGDGYKYHLFETNGSLSVTGGGGSTVDVFLVGGGGGRGNAYGQPPGAPNSDGTSFGSGSGGAMYTYGFQINNGNWQVDIGAAGLQPTASNVNTPGGANGGGAGGQASIRAGSPQYEKPAGASGAGFTRIYNGGVTIAAGGGGGGSRAGSPGYGAGTPQSAPEVRSDSTTGKDADYKTYTVTHGGSAGGSGSGGGFDGEGGGGGGGQPLGSGYGGASYSNPLAISSDPYPGTDGFGAQKNGRRTDCNYPTAPTTKWIPEEPLEAGRGANAVGRENPSLSYTDFEGMPGYAILRYEWD